MPIHESNTWPEEVRSLGTPLAVYEPTRALLLGISAAYAAAAGGLVLAGFAVISMLDPEPATPDEVLGMRIGLGAGLAIAVLCLVFAFAGHRARRRRAVAGPEGFALLWSGRTVVFHYADVAAFYRREVRVRFGGILVGTERTYTVVTADGRRQAINNFWRDAGELGRAIEIAVSRRLLPPARAAVAAGEAVAFDKLAVHRDGLVLGETDLLPWDRVQAVQVGGGYLTVRKAGQWLSWFRAPVEAVPNVTVLLALLESVRGQTPAPPT
jgi:hypothetical protein